MSFNCIICNKNYKSYQSLWNHNKKFHVLNVNNVNTNSNNVNSNVNKDTKSKCAVKNQCIYCNKIFTTRQAKSLHMKKYCKKQKELEIKEKEKEKEELKQKQVELEIKKQEAKILQLKIKLQKAKHVDVITMKKLNKMLLQHRSNITNIQNNNTNNINITNHFQILEIGKENIPKTLTFNEKREIINSKFFSLEKLIEIAHCGNYDQFKNIIITNAKDNYVHTYNEKMGYFVLAEKNLVMKNFVEMRIIDLEEIYNEIKKYQIEKTIDKNNNKVIKRKITNRQKILDQETPDASNDYYTELEPLFDNSTKNAINRFLNNVKSNDEISKINKLLFNHQEKLTNDILQKMESSKN